MKTRLLFAVATTLVAACGGEAPIPEVPPPPPPAVADPPVTSAPEPAVTAAPAEAPEADPAPAPAKPLKERVVGKWQFDFMASDPGKKTEEESKKKAGKDEKKLAELMKKAQDEAAKESIEMTADSTYVSYVGDKVVYKARYEVVKEAGTTLHVKQVGKDEISKKEMKDEIVITLVDDSTIKMNDPRKGILVFKRK